MASILTKCLLLKFQQSAFDLITAKIIINAVLETMWHNENDVCRGTKCFYFVIFRSQYTQPATTHCKSCHFTKNVHFFGDSKWEQLKVNILNKMWKWIKCFVTQFIK